LIIKISKKEIAKLAAFCFMLPLTYIFFTLFTRYLGFQKGYWLTFGIYWILLVSFTFFYLGTKKVKSLYKPDKTKKQLWNVLAFIPVVAVFFVSFVHSAPLLKTPFLLLAIAMGTLNGICEELFWRGLTVKNQGEHKTLVVIFSLCGFGLWHFTLSTIEGINYQGGILSLVGGAVAMGIIWQIVVTKTNNILYATLAHILVNVFAFSTLILENWQM